MFIWQKAQRKWQANEMKKVYISGALTRLDDKKNYRKIYEGIAAVCREFSFEVYVPHIYGDPITRPEIPPGDVWQKDHQEVSSSDVVIAYVGQPSLGVGAELEIARMACKDIILWKFSGEKVSRMALGNPSVKHIIEAKDAGELYGKLREIFKGY